MKSTPFNTEIDLPPMPFDSRHCELAGRLKENGLSWRPQVGCFVWDRDGHIQVSSPFPGRIYFILNIGHFLKLFETVERMIRQLIWLPTWHQARLLCNQLVLENQQIASLWHSNLMIKPGDELILIYEMILETLRNKEKNP